MTLYNLSCVRICLILWLHILQSRWWTSKTVVLLQNRPLAFLAGEYKAKRTGTVYVQSHMLYRHLTKRIKQRPPSAHKSWDHCFKDVINWFGKGTYFFDLPEYLFYLKHFGSYTYIQARNSSISLLLVLSLCYCTISLNFMKRLFPTS